MKKIIKATIATLAIATTLVSPLGQVSADRYEYEAIQVNVEGKILDLAVDPVMEYGTTLVPMRPIFEALGATLIWDNKTKLVTAKKDGVTIQLTIGSKTAKRNGVASTLTTSPKIVKGTTMIPFRYVGEALGMYVTWIPRERQVFVAKDREIEGTTMSSVSALNDKYAPKFTGSPFIEQPSYVAPYKTGTLNPTFIQDGLNALNFARELAGVPTVTVNPELTNLAMYGSTLMASLGQIDHQLPAAPGMSDEFYQQSSTALGRSNLSLMAKETNSGLVDAVNSLVWDGDVEGLGHRRNLLHPRVTEVGFGFNTKPDTYNKLWESTAIPQAAEKELTKPYDYISWPTKGYFPVSLMEIMFNWSISPNPRVYDTTDTSTWVGTVVNKTKGTTLALVQEETPFVYADQSNSGDGPVFYFKTEVGDDDFLDTPKAGDEIVVTLNGLKKLDGTPASISYTVRLFAF